MPKLTPKRLRMISRFQEALFVLGVAAMVTYVCLFFLVLIKLWPGVPVEINASTMALVFISTTAILLTLNFGGALKVSLDTQDLRVKINVPANTPPIMLPMLLNENDFIICVALQRYGTLDQKTMVIKYHGKTIYDKKQNRFIIRGDYYSHTLLSIV